MTSTDTESNRSIPGFRHVLEAALVFGSIGGLADVSYIITRAPDADAEFLQGLRFSHAGIFLTSLAFLPILILAWLFIRSIASKRKWRLELSLAVLYFVAILPVAVLIFRNFAVFVASESVLVTQVKSLFYFLKYLWLLLPLCWAIGAWLGHLRVALPFPTRLGRFSAFIISASTYLVLTPILQQQSLLQKANEFSEAPGAGNENTIITLGVFIGSLVIFLIGWWLFASMAKKSNGIGIALLWIAFVLVPFLPPILAGSPTKATPPSGNPVSGKKSNVIMVSLDTVRYDDLSPFGSKIVKTPTLDALAAGGTCFDNAITPMPLTGPSHISMFTGLQLDSDTGHGVKTNGIPLSEDIPTIASVLNEAGYRTGAIISGFPLTRIACGLDRGFNYYNDLFIENMRSRFLPDQIWTLTISKILRIGFKLSRFVPHGLFKPANKVTDQAISWMKQSGDKPFFLFVHYYDAHYLYAPPPPFDNMYMPDYTGPYKNKAMEWNELMKGISNFTKDDFDYFHAMYRGEISFTDQELGRLIAWGNENKLWDNTLLIVVADHGESFEHDYYFNHPDRLYDSLIHVPLIIKQPESIQVERGNRCATLVDVSDIFFTTLGFLGVTPPSSPDSMHEGVEGAISGWDHNLLELIPGTESADSGWTFIPSQSYAYAQPDEFALGRFFSFRFPDWKLIYGPDAPPRLPEYQYFDLISDPAEMKDLFPSIDWNTNPVPFAPDALKEWAAKQGLPDLSSVDPRIRAQLKALGYIQ